MQGTLCGSRGRDESSGMGSVPMLKRKDPRGWTRERQVTAPSSLGEAFGRVRLVGTSTWLWAVCCGQSSQSLCLSATSAVSGRACVRCSAKTHSQGCGRGGSSLNALLSTHVHCSQPLDSSIVSDSVSVAVAEKLGDGSPPTNCDFVTKRSSAPPSLEFPPCNI